MNPDTRPAEHAPRKAALTGWQRTLVLWANRVAYFVSRRWLALFNVVVGLYVMVPFVAPVLMVRGATGTAHLIYRIYSPACHQMAHRSWFLFGEQAFYPLSSSGIAGVRYLEEYAPSLSGLEGLQAPENLLSHTRELRNFHGNQQMGFKVALCERDVAIYLALLAGGLIFSVVRRRARPLPWQLFLLLGLLPMALDGGYQLLTYLFPTVFSPYESTPLLRTITGVLLGLGLVWLTYPHIDAGMRESEVDLRRNLVRAGVIEKAGPDR